MIFWDRDISGKGWVNISGKKTIYTSIYTTADKALIPKTPIKTTSKKQGFSAQILQSKVIRCEMHKQLGLRGIGR